MDRRRTVLCPFRLQGLLAQAVVVLSLEVGDEEYLRQDPCHTISITTIIISFSSKSNNLTLPLTSYIPCHYPRNSPGMGENLQSVNWKGNSCHSKGDVLPAPWFGVGS